MSSTTLTTHATDINWPVVFLLSMAAAIGGFLFGFDSGVINGTAEGLKQTFGSSDWIVGFNVASMLLGCALGAAMAGRVSDIFGRKPVQLVAALMFVISAWGSGIAQVAVEFVSYRAIGGIAVGAASVIAPAYISEIAPAKYRGALMSLQQVAIILGLFFAFLSNYWIAQVAGSSTQELWLGVAAWRWMFWIEMIPAMLYFIAVLFVPESPYYLAKTGQNRKALRNVAAVYRVSYASQFKAIKRSMNQDFDSSWQALFVAGRKTFKPLVWAGIGLAAFQQLVGINVVFYYGAVLWQAAGFTESHALLINIISGGVSVLACLLSISMVDRLGRKPLLMIGASGMSLCLLTIAVVFSQGQLSAEGTLVLSAMASITALISVNLYVFLFNMTWGPVMWVALGEMFPTAIKGYALSVCGLTQWLANFVVTLSFPVLLGSAGLGFAYALYAFFSLVATVFVFKVVSETKGKALHEMAS